MAIQRIKAGELFAGIGGFSIAAERCDMEIIWASEIEKNAKAIYRKHFPNVRELGSVTEWEPNVLTDTVDVITAGFPCQDLSVAGKGLGLQGKRSGLFWEIIRVAKILRPKWLVLENVPGLFSSHKGRDFGIVLAALGECGYSVSWRVLDASGFGVPQRRKRVFVVGYLGNECPPEILFESESLSGDIKPRNKKGKKVANSPTDSVGETSIGNCVDVQIDGDIHAATLRGFGHGWQGQHNSTNSVLASTLVSPHKQWNSFQNLPNLICDTWPDVAMPVMARDYKGPASFRDGGLQATVCVPPVYAIQDVREVEKRQNGKGWSDEGKSYTIDSMATQGVVALIPRKLTPLECERLQGFPDGWTISGIEDGKVYNLKDTPRYKALGNAVAVPCVEWILRNIAEYEFRQP